MPACLAIGMMAGIKPAPQDRANMSDVKPELPTCALFAFSPRAFGQTPREPHTRPDHRKAENRGKGVLDQMIQVPGDIRIVMAGMSSGYERCK